MITGIHVSSSEMIINRDEGRKNSLPKFGKNQIITATVLQRLSGGRVQLLVKGQKFAARTALQLLPGETVQLKVLSQEADILLKLIGPAQNLTSQKLSSLIRFFSQNEFMPDITGIRIPKVKDLLYDMALKSDKPDKTFLPKLIEKSGMVWEKNISRLILGNKSSTDIKSGLETLLKQDIKGNLLKALLMGASQKNDVLKAAGTFSGTLETVQLLNHQSSDSGRFLLPFPVFSEGAFRFGQLLIDSGDRSQNSSREEDKVIRVSFLLDMTRLGPLRADFSIFKKDITGRFLFKDEDTCSYVKSLIPQLKIRLADIEYHVHKIDCTLAEKEEIEPGRFIETLLRTREDSVLSVVI